MDAIQVIATKRDTKRLSTEQMEWFIESYVDGRVGDDQAAALLMAIFLNGMEPDELASWTKTMIDSGDRLDLSAVDAPTVDKHSTGGVGDKVSLILAPLVAACGAAVPMLSGRGLGHTGGTLDKLEAIPGYNTKLSNDEIVRVLQDVGAVIVETGASLAPADKKFYALRDVTGTVESIPLIASSIMSKKIAESTDALVLDVKVGSGAFLPEIDRARELARTMVGIGTTHGVKTTAVLTAMHTPLGEAAGNGLEVLETIEVLEGRGPDDLIEVTLALADEMLRLVGIDADPRDALKSGAALGKYKEMVRAQGGDPDAPLPQAKEVRTVNADRSGFVQALDARAVGIAAWRLGAGRAKLGDAVDPSAGVISKVKPGAEVRTGDIVLELHGDEPDRFDNALDALEGALVIGDEQPEERPLVIETIS
jgi:thymidine phosphorylase